MLYPHRSDQWARSALTMLFGLELNNVPPNSGARFLGIACHSSVVLGVMSIVAAFVAPCLLGVFALGLEQLERAAFSTGPASAGSTEAPA